MQSLKTEAGMSQRIRRLASKQELTASCKKTIRNLTGSTLRLWWFGDHWNCLQSPEQGLSDDEALAFLRNWTTD